jgi:hypothetical protein
MIMVFSAAVLVVDTVQKAGNLSSVSFGGPLWRNLWK